MPQIFIEDSGNLKHSKNIKGINNTTGSHLATMKGREKELF